MRLDFAGAAAKQLEDIVSPFSVEPGSGAAADGRLPRGAHRHEEGGDRQILVIQALRCCFGRAF
jgi:hypothetical protein